MQGELNLHALHIFGVVAKYESITRAAEQLFISQPAVTKQLRNLEEELGFPLTEARGRGIVLTAPGWEIARLASRIAGIHQDVLRYAEQYRAGEAGSVRVCATYLPVNFLLPRRVADYKRQYPKVRMTLETTNAEQAFRKLHTYDADLAIVGGTAAQPDGLERTELIRDEVWFVVPSGHPLAAKKITLTRMLEEEFVLREEGSSMRTMLFALCRVNGLQPPKLGLQSGGIQETIRLLSAGYGAGFVSALEAEEAVERGLLARVYVEEAEPLVNTISLYKREGEILPPAVAAFHTMLLS